MENKGKVKAMQLASVASMIDLFNKDNIAILEHIGCQVDVAANFQGGSITSDQRVAAYRQELTERGIEVYDVPIPRSVFKIGAIISSYRQIKKLADSGLYKIVHVHSPIGGVVGRIAFRKARKAGTKVVYTAHGFHFFKGASLLNWMLFYPIEKQCSKITDVLITINQEDYQRAKSWHTCKVEYVPGIGVDTEAFGNEMVDKDAMRKEFRLKDDDFVLMSTGQISVRKNHEVVIRALAKIDDERVKYLIVGFGELEERLKHLASELAVSDRVIFAGYRGDVKELLHIVDAFAFPSLQEGLPVALMEAMAVGLPVICSRIRGNVDLVEDGKGGYLYDCHDVDGFADGIKRIIQSNKYNIMGEINKKTMMRFDKNVVRSYMERIYSDQMGGGKYVVGISRTCYANVA